MKDEDADWLIYHLIPAGTAIAASVLIGKSGFDATSVEDSLARLERACLIQRVGDEIRMLSFGEALIHNQVKYDSDLPYIIENGIVKMRKK